MSIKKVEYPSCSIRSRKSWGDLRFSHKSGIVVTEEILNKSSFVVCQLELWGVNYAWDAFKSRSLSCLTNYSEGWII